MLVDKRNADGYAESVVLKTWLMLFDVCQNFAVKGTRSNELTFEHQTVIWKLCVCFSALDDFLMEISFWVLIILLQTTRCPCFKDRRQHLQIFITKSTNCVLYNVNLAQCLFQSDLMNCPFISRQKKAVKPDLEAPTGTIGALFDCSLNHESKLFRKACR